jgi:N-acetyl-gamma-glutamyl-phosphate reductase
LNLLGHPLFKAGHYDRSTITKNPSIQRKEQNPALDGGFLDATVCNNTNRADVHVFGQKDHLQVTVVLDNLGKGASGAAVQNMNIVMGVDEKTEL